MGPFVRGVVGAAAVALALTSGCASEATSSRPAVSAPPPEPVPAPPPPPSPSREAPPSAGTTAITGGTVSTTAPAEPASPAWTDAQIVAVLVAAADGDAREAGAALERSKSPRIARFAQHLENDDHVLGDQVRALAARLGTKDSASRLEVDVERNGYLVTMRDAPEEKVDGVFLRAQATQCATLIHMIDSELLGAARDPELVALVREYRAGAQHHLETAHELEESLPPKRAR